jgi:hypothetical protein
MLVELGVSRIVPSSGSSCRRRPLLHWVPSVWFPTFFALTAALRLPAPPPRLPSRFARRFRPMTEVAGSPKFLGDLGHTCPVRRLRRILLRRAPGPQSLRWPFSVLPSGLPVPSASATYPISEPSSTACALAVYASCRSLPSAHARLASDWRPFLGRAGVLPARSLLLVSSVLGYIVFLQVEACLAHGEGGNEGGGGLDAG